MPIRQQRATQSRRQKPGATNPKPQPVNVQYDSLTSTTLVLNLSVPISQLVKTGVPAVRNVTTGVPADGVALADNADPAWPTQMTLHFAGSNVGGNVFTLAAYDPAIRSSIGGYLPPLELQAPFVPPDPFDWTASADGSTNVVLSCAADSSSVTMPNGDAIAIDTSGGIAAVTRVDEVTFNLTCNNPVEPGSNITMSGAGAGCYNQVGAPAVTQTIPLAG